MKLSFIICLVSLTGFAFQDVSYPSIPDTIFINEWLLCGPFLVGTREGVTEAIEDISVIEPKEGESLRSPLVKGGVVKWQKTRVDSLGWLETNYENVWWDSIQDYYGISGLTSLGYAYAEIACSTRCRALAIAQRCSFILNGRGYLGDIYGNGWFKTPVVLDSGVNRFILRISGYGDQKVRFLLVPAPEPIIPLVADATTPDIVADETTNSFIGIPFLNTTLKVIDSMKIIIALDTISVLETIVNNIPILGGKKVAFPIKLSPIPYDSSPISLYLKTKWRDYQRTDTINLRIRNLTQGHKMTFLSEMDSSCQYYAILYPKEYDPKKKYGLILSLHGAGVEASGLIECFKPKDWAFVVCPTNRRPYGFDWQDWGRLDALEVLNICLKKFPIDPNLVYLTGHSMGGHGTWHIGLAHPDRFAAIAPEAGWPSFPLYVPNFLQRSIIFSEPQKLAIREMATRPDNTPAFIENAFNLPIFILHGGNDDNVPTLHGRNFALWLEALGYNYRYKEVPGKGHWWNYDDGTVCVDDPELMEFFAAHRRNPGPKEIRFRTADLGQSAECYWVKIDRVNTIGNDAVIYANATDSLITIKTINIVQLTLNLDQELFFPHPIRIDIDGETVVSQLYPPARLFFHKTTRGWRLGKSKYSRLHKTPDVYGPAKQVLMKPWIIVYGTLDKNIALDLRHAATQEALRWWLIGNGTVEVFPDTLVDLSDKRNLVLLGGPSENLLTKQIASYLPIKIKNNEVQLSGNFSAKDSVAVILTYPNPINPERLVLIRMGTNSASTKLSLFWGVIGSGTAIPDFMIFDRRVRRFGWAGVIAAGFWGPDWNFDPRSTFVQQ
ncbi:MAG: prolyl oligopeptidase family serine peptidase [candidate division WOR-3 bacterium]